MSTAGHISIDYHPGVTGTGGVLRLIYQASDENGYPRTAVQACPSTNSIPTVDIDNTVAQPNGYAAYPYLQFALRRNVDGKWLKGLDVNNPSANWGAANEFSFIDQSVCPKMADLGVGSWTDSASAASDPMHWQNRMPPPWNMGSVVSGEYPIFNFILEGLYFIDIPCDFEEAGQDALGMSYADAEYGFRFMVADANFMNMQGLPASAWVIPQGPPMFSYANITISSPAAISSTDIVTGIFDEPLANHTTAGTFGDALTRMLALRQHNMQAKYTAWNSAGVPSAGTIYIYATKAALELDSAITGNGAIGEYEFTAEFDTTTLEPTTYRSKRIA